MPQHDPTAPVAAAIGIARTHGALLGASLHLTWLDLDAQRQVLRDLRSALGEPTKAPHQSAHAWCLGWGEGLRYLDVFVSAALFVDAPPVEQPPARSLDEALAGGEAA